MTGRGLRAPFLFVLRTFMAKPKNLCIHGLGASYCKGCKSDYDFAYKTKRQEEYYSWIESIGCECCGFSDRFALEFHHYAAKYKRYGRSQGHIHNRQDYESGTGLVLCGNCHNIFHGVFGGKANQFPELNKEQTVSVIRKRGTQNTDPA